MTSTTATVGCFSIASYSLQLSARIARVPKSDVRPKRMKMASKVYYKEHSRVLSLIYYLTGVFYMVIGGYYNDGYDPEPTTSRALTNRYPTTTLPEYTQPFPTTTAPNNKFKVNFPTEYLTDVELVSLDPDYPVPPCLTGLNDFPIGLFGASGSVGDGNIYEQFSRANDI